MVGMVNGCRRRGEKAPRSKLQAPEKLQNSSSKRAARTVWSLALEVSLELAAWILELSVAIAWTFFHEISAAIDPYIL
jgi:hypothetical protein